MSQSSQLERLRNLLNLVLLEIEACGACSGGVSRRMDAAMHIVDELLGVTPRFDDGHTHADADAAERPPAGSAGGAGPGEEGPKQ